MADFPPQVAAALRVMREKIRGAGLEPSDAFLLFEHVTGLGRLELLREPELALRSDQVSQLQSALGRRLAREPVHRIIGMRSFYGREFSLSPDTLEPRADSECLIDLALDLLAHRAQERLSILDLGTGTGILAVTLATKLPNARALAVDLSPGALATASVNALRNGVGERVMFLESDWFARVQGRFDLIISNPPYIESAAIAGLEPEVRDHDPALALDGGPDGLAAYRRIAAHSAQHLNEGGIVLVEIGAGQVAPVRALFEAEGYPALKFATDLGDVERAIAFARSE